MKHQSKFSQEQQHAAAHQAQSQAGQEFSGSEELLRFDAAQTTVPPQIAERLKRSAADITPPKSGWLKRLFN
jgi:hypothetical protein